MHACLLPRPLHGAVAENLAQWLGSAEHAHRCREVGPEAEACMAVPRAVTIPCSLVETSPSDHSLHSPDPALPPKEPLAMSPPERCSMAHDTHDQAQSGRWPRIRGHCCAAAPTLPLSSTPSPWQISLSLGLSFPARTIGTASMASQICHESLCPGLGNVDSGKDAHGMGPVDKTGLCPTWDQPWTVSLCADPPSSGYLVKGLSLASTSGDHTVQAA